MKTSSFIKQLFAALFFMALASGCAQPIQQEVAYDRNSWKTIISESCRSYFDGCNNCRRGSVSGIAACTRKACIGYKKPVCLDGAN